jgi:ankyrin repeat protein
MRDRFTKLGVELFECVEVLSEYSNDELLTLKSPEDESILHIACFKDNKTLKILLREFKTRGILEEMMLMKNESVGWSCLHCAVWHGDKSNLITVLTVAADNDLLTELLYCQDFNLNTSLHIAFYHSTIAVSQLLIGAAYDNCILTSLLSYRNDIGKVAIEYLKDDSPLHEIITVHT